MKEIITKDSLNQSIDLISELNLNEEDYEKIFDQFKVILENEEIKEVINKTSNTKELKDENDLKSIMKKIANTFDVADMSKFLKIITSNEKLLDFIQDLFLEKLI